MNVDGNATISHPEVKRTSEQALPAVPPIKCQEAAVQTQPLELVSDWELWIPHSEWFKTNIEKIDVDIQSIREAGKTQEVHDQLKFYEQMSVLGFEKADVDSILEKKKGRYKKQLVRHCRLFKQNIAIDRFLDFLNNCDKRKSFFGQTEPCNQPITTFAKEEPCNSPNLQGCLCPRPRW